jgi:hypothetical protein
MTVVDLGVCCTSCLMAINQEPLEWVGLPDEEELRRSRAALEQLQAREGLYSLETGDECGFSWLPCDGCGSSLGGDRHRLIGLPPTEIEILREWFDAGYDSVGMRDDGSCYPCRSMDIPLGAVDEYLSIMKWAGEDPSVSVSEAACEAICASRALGWKY